MSPGQVPVPVGQQVKVIVVERTHDPIGIVHRDTQLLLRQNVTLGPPAGSPPDQAEVSAGSSCTTCTARPATGASAIRQASGGRPEARATFAPEAKDVYKRIASVLGVHQVG